MSSKVIIEDQFLKPYRIKVTENSFDILFDKFSEEKGTTYTRTLGYYSTLRSALKEVAKLKILDKGGKTNLSKYIKELSDTHKLLIEKIVW